MKTLIFTIMLISSFPCYGLELDDDLQQKKDRIISETKASEVARKYIPSPPLIPSFVKKLVDGVQDIMGENRKNRVIKSIEKEQKERNRVRDWESRGLRPGDGHE